MPVSPLLRKTPSLCCLHCRTALDAGAAFAPFCCRGCRAVHDLLLEQGLGRFYDLAGAAQVSPVAELPSARSHTWLEPLVEAAQQQSGEVCSLQLDIQGIECAACVWLMNETFARRAGAASLTVNPALGQAHLQWSKGVFDVDGWVREVEGYGYQLGPARKKSSARSFDWPLRLGICAGLSVNVMLFSLSFYFGLSRDEPEVFSLFTWLSCALSTAVVVIGGWPFFRAAIRGARSGLLHLDAPIALGICLVYGMSLLQLRTGRGDLTYFDTLNTFITLMVLGRFLQERLLERNRRFLLEDEGAEGILVRRVEGPSLVIIPAPRIARGDLLLVAPGELIPVEATLVEPTALISTDWVTGESAKRDVSEGSVLPAGSFNAGGQALHVVARTNFADSTLVALLRQTRVVDGRHPRHLALWNGVARSWVVKVLLIATAGFMAWLPEGLDTAINVAVSLLVVTCPCAIGIAIPLAYEVTQAQLRRSGFFIRSADLLDRLTGIKKVLFDKTGTLTLGRLELADVPRLNPALRDLAYNMAARSSHPVSCAISGALQALHPIYDPHAQVTELQGRGLEWSRPDGTWRLGRPDWAAAAEATSNTVLTCDGAVMASFATRESLRADTARELGLMQREGLAIWLVSGDSTARVSQLAHTLGLDASHALAGQTPEAKAAIVERLDDQDTLYLGDGVNDSLAFAQAHVAGTPVIDRPVMPGKSDFFLVGQSLSPIREALARATQLRRVVQRILALSLTYNVFAVGLALFGKMSPLLAAITMPLSTLTLLAITALSLRRRTGETAAWCSVSTQNLHEAERAG